MTPLHRYGHVTALLPSSAMALSVGGLVKRIVTTHACTGRTMGSRLRLLVIDDNPADLELTHLVFEQLAPPVQVGMYDSGEDALLALRTPHAVMPDVILL